MPFPKKLLNSYETVKLDLRPHWWYVAPAVASLVAAVIFGIYALTTDSDPLKWLALVLVVIAAIWVIDRYIKWTTTHFVITSDRLIYRSGFIRKAGIQIPLERVNNVNFRQGVFERIIGAGDLLVESGGEDGQQRFSDIRHPDRVMNLIHEAIDENQGGLVGGMGALAQAAAPDVVTQVERLEGLLERGTITREEFEAQKRKLLG
jgi:membrane protein YdbS with pleckstrin-like domain